MTSTTLRAICDELELDTQHARTKLRRNGIVKKQLWEFAPDEVERVKEILMRRGRQRDLDEEARAWER